jgi:transcription initiation factor TFIID TATA-box-binding protein
MLPEIQNIICTVDLDCVLELFYIASHGVNVEYNPKKIDALTMRIRNPRSSANIFTSGKMVCLGTKDEDMARKATRRFARIVQKLGFPVKFLNFRITNIVASVDLKFRPNFSELVRCNRKYVDYNPEIFPGLIYRKKITIVIFRSGKINMTNAKTRKEIYEAFNEFQKSINRT